LGPIYQQNAFILIGCEKSKHNVNKKTAVNHQIKHKLSICGLIFKTHLKRYDEGSVDEQEYNPEVPDLLYLVGGENHAVLGFD